MNREITNENDSRRKFNPEATSKDFTSEQTQVINTINTIFNHNNKFNSFDFTDSKTEKIFTHEYLHWGPIKKNMNLINKREKVRELFG